MGTVWVMFVLLNLFPMSKRAVDCNCCAHVAISDSKDLFYDLTGRSPANLTSINSEPITFPHFVISAFELLFFIPFLFTLRRISPSIVIYIRAQVTSLRLHQDSKFPLKFPRSHGSTAPPRPSPRLPGRLDLRRYGDERGFCSDAYSSFSTFSFSFFFLFLACFAS